MIAIKFIVANQAHNTIAKNALRITVLMMPSMLPMKYNGIKISVAGSSTVNVRIALAASSTVVSTISQ